MVGRRRCWWWVGGGAGGGQGYPTYEGGPHPDGGALVGVAGGGGEEGRGGQVGAHLV